MAAAVGLGSLELRALLKLIISPCHGQNCLFVSAEGAKALSYWTCRPFLIEAAQLMAVPWK
ncbi:putative membrane protein insertion efficiency factor, partial [Clarias magur]